MDSDNTRAEHSLRLLAQHFREHPVTGPTGRRATSVTPGTPVNLAVVDRIDAAVRELADYTREHAPDASPRPAAVEDVYRWCVENTATADEHAQLRRDVTIYRQHLEHALAMGDTKVIPPHRCPACRTFGLRWKPSLQRALCTNRRCTTRDGLSRTWSLGRLAWQHVSERKNLDQVNAT
jgi:hypothetical protein